jgi:hypothetical protein
MQEVEPSSRGAGSEPQYCFAKPGWFAPQGSEAYEAWRCTGGVDCWLFRDRRTKDLYNVVDYGPEKAEAVGNDQPRVPVHLHAAIR